MAKGSRGGKYSGSSQTSSPQNIQQQAPSPNNTPVQPSALDNISSLSDVQLANLLYQADGIQMPNMLSDMRDPTQEFVFATGLNEKPLVLDSAEFNQFMQDNGISQSEIMSRSVNSVSYRNADGTQIKLSGDQVLNTMMYSRLNYIGGKRGGQLYGAGTYFDMNGGSNTGYGSSTAYAVLNPKTARVISESQLISKIRTFQQTHPKTAAAIHSMTGYSGAHHKNYSLYALAMGYNVIREGSAGYGYHNVIDRKALVYRKK